MLSSSRLCPTLSLSLVGSCCNLTGFHRPLSGARGNFKYSWSDFDPLDLFEGKLLPSPIMELGRARRFAIGRSGQVRPPKLDAESAPSAIGLITLGAK
jgi:hypothetical protein